MVPATTTDQLLPPGWKEYVKFKNGRKTKYYSRAATGQKFYSKLAVMRYMNMPIDGANTTRPQSETDCNQTPQTPTNHEKRASVRQAVINTAVGIAASETDLYEHQGSVNKKGCRSRNGKIRSRSNESSDVIQSGSVDGLPVGWTKEIKIRHYATRIKKDPYYKDPLSGYVFCSKKDALRYLDTGDISKCSIRPMKGDEPHAVSHEDASSNELSGHHITRKHQRSISKLEVNKVNNYPAEPVISDQLQNSAVDGLPIGWTREIQIRRDGHGKDSFYTDPISGYMFRSKKDTLRYIETGDVSKCACKPKLRDANDIGSAKQACSKDQSSISDKEQNKINNSYGELVETGQLPNPAEVGLPIGWTKDYFYADPISGYMFRSTEDALWYIETGDITCAYKPKKMDVNDTGSTKQHVSGILNSAVDELPIGWTREIRTRRDGIGRDTLYTDPVSRYVFRSKKDALRYIETGDISKCAIKPKKRDASDTGSTKQVRNNGVSGHHILRNDQSTSVCKREQNKRNNHSGETVEYLHNSSVDGLPIGWIREIQTRRDGIGKDSIYIDPVSGYMFRSKIDALRFIETGDISKCASKPRKRDANAAGSAEHVGDLLTPVSRRNLLRSSSRQHYISEKSNDGEKNCDASIPKAVKSESSLRKRGSSLPSRIQTKSRRVSQPSEQELHGKRIMQSTPGRTSKRLAGCQPEMPNLQVSERGLRAAMKMSCEDEANIWPMITMNDSPNGLPQPLCPEPGSVDANSSGKLELPKQIMKQKVSRNTPAKAQKSNNGITPSTPGRTSSTHTGSGYQFLFNPQLSEGSLGAEMRKSSEEEAQVFPWININDVPDVVPQPFHCELSTATAVGMSAKSEPYPLDTEPAPEVADIVSMAVESVPKINIRQKFEEHSAQQINEKQDPENFKPQDVQGGYQFGDPLPNPFMNFSFNNPTGPTPDENNLAYQGYSQQQTSNLFVHNSGWSICQNFGFHDGNPSNSNSVRQQAHVDQLPSQFSMVTPGFGVPSFGSTGFQQPDNSAFKRNI